MKAEAGAELGNISFFYVGEIRLHIEMHRKIVKFRATHCSMLENKSIYEIVLPYLL